MPRINAANRGIVLLLVLGMLLVVIALANVFLNIILNQSFFTHHQTSRIQAYYAAQSGINYALERLRNGSWVAGINCPAVSPCQHNFAYGDFLPDVIVGRSVSIVIIRQPGPGCVPPGGSLACVSAKADYTPP